MATKTRIHAIPPPSHPPHAIPLYGLPSAEVNYDLNRLEVYWGDGLLADEETIRPPVTLALGDEYVFEITVRNPVENSQATTTFLTFTDDIDTFPQRNTSPSDYVGLLLEPGEEFIFYVTTNYNQDTIQGIVNFAEQFVVGSTFAGQEGEESNVVNVEYTVATPIDTRNGKQKPLTSGKLSPNSYTDEYTERLNRNEENRPDSTRPRTSG